LQIRELAVPDAYELTPAQHRDTRGVFLEWFIRDQFERETGHRLALAQANCSVSGSGVVRGLHFADVPPGQAKYVTCASGAVLDVVVDIRVGSPTYGTSDAVVLDDVDRRSVYLAEGLGHGFMALSEQATLVYLCSEQYNPAREHGVHALDPELAIAWPDAEPAQLSPRDAAAPSLVDAERAGLLPSYTDCQDLYGKKRRGRPA
jgi:dTDP-4-dehydrorhamnose 3,5-epimerase